mgnify:CR=1 FL=1
MSVIERLAPLYTRLSEQYGLGHKYPECLLEHHKCKYHAAPIDYTFVDGVCTSYEVHAFDEDSRELLDFARDNTFPEKFRPLLTSVIRRLLWMIRSESQRVHALARSSITEKYCRKLTNPEVLQLVRSIQPCLQPVHDFETRRLIAKGMV